MAKFHAMPTDAELSDKEREQGYHTRAWAGRPSHRCNKCKYNSLIETDTQLHFYYKHIVSANQVDVIVNRERAVTVPLLDHQGKQVAALADQIRGKEVVLPVGYKPPEIVNRVIAEAKTQKKT